MKIVRQGWTITNSRVGKVQMGGRKSGRRLRLAQAPCWLLGVACGKGCSCGYTVSPKPMTQQWWLSICADKAWD